MRGAVPVRRRTLQQGASPNECTSDERILRRCGSSLARSASPPMNSANLRCHLVRKLTAVTSSRASTPSSSSIMLAKSTNSFAQRNSITHPKGVALDSLVDIARTVVPAVEVSDIRDGRVDVAVGRRAPAPRADGDAHLPRATQSKVRAAGRSVGCVAGSYRAAAVSATTGQERNALPPLRLSASSRCRRAPVLRAAAGFM